MKADDRLTRWNGKIWVLPQGRGSFRMIAERLAAYENTGLTPDEIMRLKGCRLIDRDALIESFRTSGQFDISELGAIIPIIEEQQTVAFSEGHDNKPLRILARFKKRIDLEISQKTDSLNFMFIVENRTKGNFTDEDLVELRGYYKGLKVAKQILVRTIDEFQEHDEDENNGNCIL